MRKYFSGFFILLLFAIGNVQAQVQNTSKEEWVHLFNGKDLNDWIIKIAKCELNDNYKNTFKVENGILKINYDEYEKFGGAFGHIYYKQSFSYYKIVVEYRFTGNQLLGGAISNNRNSGVMIHSQPPQTMSLNQAFPVSLEVQILGGLSDGKPRSTGNLCTPGTMIEMEGKLSTEHCMNSKSKTYDGDQWVKLEVLVLGDSLIQHIVSDEIVLEYSKPRIGEVGPSRGFFLDKWGTQNDGLLLTGGYIALQAESHPVEFRKVHLLNLKGCMNKKCPNYKPYYVVQGECSCQH